MKGVSVMVYVLDINGQPLMPTDRYGKVKHLLRQGKAVVVKRCPFTIRLLYVTTAYTQKLTLGVDTGSGTLGAAVLDEKRNVVYMSKVIVRNDITDKMTQRAKYRRSRRNSKTRYRKARWLNRKNSIKTGRFSPTMISKIHSHVKEIEYIKSILPITTLVLETGQFDTHLMRNPALANSNIKHWGYQKGINYGFENTKAMVLNRDNYTCQYCKGKHKDPKLEVHHIVFRSQGGSDKESNLITLCHTCHKDLHSGKITPKFTGKKKGTLKYATQMNSIRCQLLKQYPEAIETFGYATKANRLSIGIEKDHHLDACVIASQGLSINIKTNLAYLKKSVSKGDYQQTKGIRSEQPIPTGKICGFRKYDKVKYFGKEYFIKGRMSTGYAILMDIDGNKIDFSAMPKGFKTPKLSNCKRVVARTSQMIQVVTI
jgi:hypothetical protein